MTDTLEDVVITRHAEKRLAERSGLNKSAMQRMCNRAFYNGIKHSDTKGRLNKWVTSLYFRNPKANNLRLYGDKVFIFSDKILVTVMQIPNNLKKDLRAMSK